MDRSNKQGDASIKQKRDNKATSCRWIFKVKYNVDGMVNRYKARFIAKQYTQTHGVDYEETFPLVANMTTVRTVIALTTARGWHLPHIYVKNVFLPSELEEEVYMIQSPDF